jgi:multicomponent Na+:H+ antiporter subunit E
MAMSQSRPSTGPFTRRIWALQTFALLLLVWLALDGSGALVVGLVLAAAGALTGLWLVPGEPYPWHPLRLAAFLGYFVVESFRGGVDVAWRVLHPRMPVDPVYRDFDTALPAGLPRSVFVSVVNLLPGTLCVQLSDDGRVRIHALTAGAGDGVPRLERRVRRLFGIDHGARDEPGRPIAP